MIAELILKDSDVLNIPGFKIICFSSGCPLPSISLAITMTAIEARQVIII
jgi:hypothetical protein